MGEIANRLNEIRQTIPQHVTLVAVSKTKPENSIVEAYNVGQRIFGENKAQELCVKYENLPKDIEWHFIGHLQTNKIKYIASFVSLIHSVDSLKLLIAINNEAKKCDRIINCLLQFYVATEDTKWGLYLEEAIQLLQSNEFNSLKNICICGVMGMATFTDDEKQIRTEFAQLKEIFNHLKRDCFYNSNAFKHISMGMSHDYKIAIEQGSSIVRIGTTIFGDR